MAKTSRNAGRDFAAMFFWFCLLAVSIANGWKGFASFILAMTGAAIALPLLFLATKWIKEEGKFTLLGWLLWLVVVVALNAMLIYLFIPIPETAWR